MDKLKLNLLKKRLYGDLIQVLGMKGSFELFWRCFGDRLEELERSWCQCVLTSLIEHCESFFSSEVGQKISMTNGVDDF